MNLKLIFPEMIAAGFLVILMIKGMFKADKPIDGEASWRTGILAALVTLVCLFPFAGHVAESFGGMFLVDNYAVFFKALFAIALMGIILISREFFIDNITKSGDFLLIMWSSFIGLFFLVSANDLLLAFVALEIFSLSLYVLAAYQKHESSSIEAGLKYFIMGSLASAFIIFGIALLYFSAGSTSFTAVREIFTQNPSDKVVLLGVLLMISGVGFKIAAAPFQLWVPDVYEGAPTPVTAYLSIVSKSAGIALLLRLVFDVFAAFDAQRALLFSGLAVVTLVYGNLGALVQTNIKRLLGYSSIGHAGYLLIGIAAGKVTGVLAILYYLIAYAVSSLLAFMVITLAGKTFGNDTIKSYRGLGKRCPCLAGSFFIALLSLAGIPPLAGFFGKFLVLYEATRSDLVGLATLGLLGVAVSLYYYLSVVKAMYFEEPESDAPIKLSATARAFLVVLIILVFVIGLWQAPFYFFAQSAANALF